MRRVVTIDGPAGSGKSTVARIVAARLGWRLLDTGAMYRAVALAGLRKGIDLADAEALGAMAEGLTVQLPPGKVVLNGRDVTADVRTVEVTRAVRYAADNPAVRRRLAVWQRAFAGENDTITEGRDQGTIVFPDAPCKFFLTADPAERARRRHAEFLRRGEVDRVRGGPPRPDRPRRPRRGPRHRPAAAGAGRGDRRHDRPDDRAGRRPHRGRRPRLRRAGHRLQPRPRARPPMSPTAPADPRPIRRVRDREREPQVDRDVLLCDRSRGRLLVYRLVQWSTIGLFNIYGGFRATGRRHVPSRGPALIVANHLSFWDVFVIGVRLRRPLNYVARSTLFTATVGWFLRTIGAFPIAREGVGAQGFKETLRRTRAGGIVTFFPEGTRTPDGALKELKPGIATLAVRADVPVIPAGIAGTFEAWPRHRRFPRPHPLRIHYGRPIPPEALAGLDQEAATALIRRHLERAIRNARRMLDRDLGRRTPPALGG